MLMSGFLLTYGLFQFFWGWFVKRFGPRMSAIVGIIVWAASMTLSGIAATAGAMIAARVALGIGEAFMFPVSNTFVANWFPIKERARASTFWLNGITLGPIIAGALIVAVTGMGGWRMVFFVLAALSILIPLPMVIFLMRDHPRQQRFVSAEEANFIEAGSWEKTDKIPKGHAKKGFLSNYRFWLITIAWSFHNIFYWGWGTWMPTYFQTVRHFSFKSAGYAFSLTFLFVLGAVLTVGYLSDRSMRRAPFGSLLWIASGILFFIGGTVIDNAHWALLVLIIAVCCGSPAFMMSQTLLQSIIPEHLMGSAVGVAGGVSTLISVTSPALIGFLVGGVGFGAAIVFLAVISSSAGLLILPLIREGY